MDPANRNEALRETLWYSEEGADMIMVKPAGFYLDIIYKLKQNFPGSTPLRLSGEWRILYDQTCSKTSTH